MIWSSQYAGRNSTPGGGYRRLVNRVAWEQRQWRDGRKLRKYKKTEPVDTNVVNEKRYTKTQLNEIADQLLRDDARSEVCRSCEEPGSATGQVMSEVQYENGKPITDNNGQKLSLDFPEYICPHGHRWYEGEGKAKGIGGENPILFEEHFRSRMRREIYTKAESAMGKPDPEIESGLYWRTHPQGRKQNDDRSRREHGSGFYK